MKGVANKKIKLALQGQSDKEKKYDRQLRLWAAEGQEALEQADILLINSGCGALGVEILKNLVLPGIGKFTIIDNKEVSEADLGVNFFLDENCLGKSRAKYCVKFLRELNTDVSGDYFTTLDGTFLQSLFSNRSFSFIICTLPIQPEILSSINEQALKSKTPLILSHSVGFYSYFRTMLPVTIPIVDTHPELEAKTDLRLLNPWKELSDFSKSLTNEIDLINDHKHGHIPYVALLLHFLGDWKKINGKWPSSYAEKMKFRNLVASKTRKNENDEENFNEAVAAVMKNVKASTLSTSARELFDYQPDDIEAKSSFWIITEAVKKFYEKHKLLPLPGSLPDMKAESDVYVQLQKIYKRKARQDVAEVFETIRKDYSGRIVGIEEVENFCKNAAHAKLIYAFNRNAIDIETIAKTEFENDKNSTITSQPLSLFPIYLALSATSHVSMASSSDIISSIEKNIQNAGSNARIRKISSEVARAKGGELHNISALTGGMVAQEVIKLVTRQYIPIDNTCIFDGINSRVQVLKI